MVAVRDAPLHGIDERVVGSSVVRVNPIASENLPSLQDVDELLVRDHEDVLAAKWPITKPVSLFWGFLGCLVGVFV